MDAKGLLFEKKLQHRAEALAGVRSALRNFEKVRLDCEMSPVLQFLFADDNRLEESLRRDRILIRALQTCLTSAAEDER